MAAFLLFLLAVAGGVVVGDLVWENRAGAEVSVFGEPVADYPLGWLLAMAATLGFVVALCAGPILRAGRYPRLT